MLDRAKNPFFDHGTAEYFVAERGGRVVGRIAGVTNRLHNETHADRVGFWGWFECEDDPAAARALFDAAGDWLRAQPGGYDTMRGPASFSVWDEFGLLVEGNEHPATLMMAQNPAYYQPLVEGAGFVKAKDLVCYEGVEPPPEVAERIERGVAMVQKRYGLRTRYLDKSRMREELDLVMELLEAGWEKNWGAIPITPREVQFIADNLSAVIVPSLVAFIYREEQPIGFCWSMPDLYAALRPNRSGAFLPGLLRVLWGVKMKRISRCRTLLLGTRPEWRGKGLDAVLIHEVWKRGIEQGLHWGEAGWILEDNTAMRTALEKFNWRKYKTYRVYDRPL
ncbi:MAG: hypothetical protein NW201_11015 [Gemmatimonadales bacterium]|nr:hypothetical protein [Gemmatimonadales bacterium]